MLLYVLFVCKCLLPPGDNPIAVNEYVISYIVRARVNVSVRCLVLVKMYGKRPKKLFVKIMRN